MVRKAKRRGQFCRLQSAPQYGASHAHRPVPPAHATSPVSGTAVHTCLLSHAPRAEQSPGHSRWLQSSCVKPSKQRQRDGYTLVSHSPWPLQSLMQRAA